MSALRREAEQRLADGDVVGALQAAGRAAAADPVESWPHLFAAEVFTGQGDGPNAVRAAREAVRCAPQRAEAHLALARALIVEHAGWQHAAPSRRGPAPLVEAWEVARQGVRLAPFDAASHATLGAVALASQHLDVAERAYLEAARLAPGDAEVDQALAAIRLGRGQLTRAVAGFAGDPLATRLLGWRLARKALWALVLVTFALAQYLSWGDPTGGRFGLLVTVVVLAVPVAGLVTALRLPPPARPVLVGELSRGWGPPAAFCLAVSLGLLVAAATGGPDGRGTLTVLALVALLVGQACVSAGVRALVRQ